jgi:hypothetical protein
MLTVFFASRGASAMPFLGRGGPVLATSCESVAIDRLWKINQLQGETAAWGQPTGTLELGAPTHFQMANSFAYFTIL